MKNLGSIMFLLEICAFNTASEIKKITECKINIESSNDPHHTDLAMKKICCWL